MIEGPTDGGGTARGVRIHAVGLRLNGSGQGVTVADARPTS